MDGGSRQPRQQFGRAGGGKGKAKSKVKLCKPAFLPFEKALLYARSLKLKRAKEWEAWPCEHALNSASGPQTRRVARMGALAGHWQCCSQRPPVLAVQEGAAACTHTHAEKPKRMARLGLGVRPSNPDGIYQHTGWQGHGHWLGTGTVAPKDQQFLPFKEALLHTLPQAEERERVASVA